METESKLILEELKAIRSDLNFIKEHVIDVDLVMTDDDLESLRIAEKELKAGQTKRIV